MSDSADKAASRKGGKKKLMMLAGGILLLGGGGAAAGFIAAGSMHGGSAATEDPFKPRLVPKGGDPEAVANEWIAKAKEAGESTSLREGAGVDLPRPRDSSAYQATYFQIPAPFTTNMADSAAFAQISIAVSTYYDARVIQAVQTHELAIRSAILLMLAQEQEAVLQTPQGKEQLQAKLLKIVNDTLKAKTGFSGIDNVYFTNFVIQ